MIKEAFPDKETVQKFYDSLPKDFFK